MPKFKSINSEDVSVISNIVGNDNLTIDAVDLDKYSRDYTEDLSFLPSAVVFPRSAYEVSEILQYCNEQLIPVTPRGAGTSLSGGALPICGGLVLSTERMNSILDIDNENFMVTLEPGVVNQELRESLHTYGLTYPQTYPLGEY